MIAFVGGEAALILRRVEIKVVLANETELSVAAAVSLATGGGA